jgi:DNA-binding MarR family transcriptional regulator
MRILLAHDFYRSSAPSGEDAVYANERALLESRGHEVIAFERRNDDIDESTLGKRVRLAIVSALAVNDTMKFGDLKALLGTTDGNLSVHARKLEDAGYVTCTKGFDGRRPRTEYQLTALGRRELARYLTHMEALIRATRDTLGR